MKNNIKRVGVIGLAVALSVSSLVGCKKKDEGPTKEELQVALNTANTNIATLQNQLNGTKEVLATYDPSLTDIDLSAITLLPTGQQAYTSINSKIRLHSQLDMSPSTPLPNTTEVVLGGNIHYIPSNNWTFELNNNVVRLQHKSGMLVTLKVYKYVGSSTPYDVMDTTIRPYLTNLSATEASAKQVFINGSVVGGLITSDMKVKAYKDEEVIEEYIPEPETTEAETLPVETDADGNVIETESSEGAEGEVTETTGESVAVHVIEPGAIPASGFGTLDESAASTEGSSVESSEESVEGSEGSSDSSSDGGIETVAETEAQTEPVELDYDIEDYRYVVGVFFSNDYALTFEAFYANDENASIQEELLNTCLSSITINGTRLATE